MSVSQIVHTEMGTICVNHIIYGPNLHYSGIAGVCLECPGQMGTDVCPALPVHPHDTVERGCLWV